MTQEQRINDILEVLLRYTVRDFSERIEISESGDELDAVAVGINTLGEEMAAKLREVEHANERLLRKNKELERYTYISSHDLQEPLRTILNFTTLFQEEYSEKFDDNAKVYFRFIQEAANRMHYLLRGLMEYSRIGQNASLSQVKMADVWALCKMEHANVIAQEEIEVTNDELPEVFGYQEDLKFLLLHLLDNAIKFSQNQGKAKIHLSFKDELDYWQFELSDNGIGMEEEQTERVFNLFERLHPREKYAGIGIGLAHCRKVIDLHQGKIWIESQPFEGSTVYFKISKDLN